VLRRGLAGCGSMTSYTESTESKLNSNCWKLSGLRSAREFIVSLICLQYTAITGRFKWLALYFGVPVTILGVALMIKFRQPDHNVGYLVMCQFFIAFSSGTLVICEQIAVMAASTHQYCCCCCRRHVLQHWWHDWIDRCCSHLDWSLPQEVGGVSTCGVAGKFDPIFMIVWMCSCRMSLGHRPEMRSAGLMERVRSIC
jgi:hypothetical protein